MIVVKRIKTSYNSILRAKLYFFWKKSFWMYLIGMTLLGYALPLPSLGIAFSALIYFFIFLIVVLVPLYHFSSKRLAHKNQLDADIEFAEQEITIRHRNKPFVEIKDWTWVKELHITRDTIFVIVNYPHRFLMSIDRNGLSENEADFFAGKVSSKKSA